MDIEKRLKTLEKRARTDDERWQMLDAQIKAFRLIFPSIGASICAGNPSILSIIIANLRTYEESARMMNEHAMTIREFQFAREFFESRRKTGEGDLPSADGKSPL
jgi:hypothetical protein